MVWSVVNSFLDTACSLDELDMVSRPQTSKILSVDLDNLSLWIRLLDFVKNMIQMVVDFGDKIPGIQETLSEILPRFFARYRDLF